MVNLKVIFLNTRRIKCFFPYKDCLNRSQRSKVVYKASFWDCDDFYIGKTKRRSPNMNTHQLAIDDDIMTTGHNIKRDHFEILASGKIDYHCKIKETLFIHVQELNPTINANLTSDKLSPY